MKAVSTLLLAALTFGAFVCVSTPAMAQRNRNQCYNDCYDRRGDLEQRRQRAERERREADAYARRTDQIYRGARAVDEYAPYLAPRPHREAYRAVRREMDRPIRPFERRVTPREECEAFPSVSGALRCRRN